MRSRIVTSLLVTASVVMLAAGASAHAGAEKDGRARATVPLAPAPVALEADFGPAPAITPRRPEPPPLPASPRPAPRSAFGLRPRSAMAVQARRPSGVLVGDRVVELSSEAPTWSSTALGSGTTTTFPAPVRLVPSGRSAALAANALAANAWVAGDVIVARGATHALVVEGDGAVARGERRAPSASLLGAVGVGPLVLAWWRAGSQTEVAALERATARIAWRRVGPAWAWDAQMVSGGGRAALLADDIVEVLDASTGATLGRFAVAALRGDASWPHPMALGPRGELVVAAPGGVVVVDPVAGTSRALASGLGGGSPSLVAADERAIYAVIGEDLVAIDLATAAGGRAWAVRVAFASALHVAGEHVIHCDADGGASVIDRENGAVMLRVGVRGCTGAAARPDGTLALAGHGGTWVVAPARDAVAAPPARAIEGTLTLDGAPAPGLPVLLGVLSFPMDGLDGCPPLPAYGRCVLTDARGRFRAVVPAQGLLPILADHDAAARRAGRARATGESVELDLDAGPPAPVQLALRGADEER